MPDYLASLQRNNIPPPPGGTPTAGSCNFDASEWWMKTDQGWFGWYGKEWVPLPHGNPQTTRTYD